MFSIFLLLPLYFIGIQYERGGWWRSFALVAIIAWILDIILNYIEFTIFLQQLPHYKDYTISMRMRRLRDSEDDYWQNRFARYIAKVLDVIAPSGKHT